MSVELTLACCMMDKFEKATEGVLLTVSETIAVVRAYAAIAQVEATRENTEVLKELVKATRSNNQYN